MKTAVNTIVLHERETRSTAEAPYVEKRFVSDAMEEIERMSFVSIDFLKAAASGLEKLL